MSSVKQLLLAVLAVVAVSCKNELSPFEYIEEVNRSKDLNKQYEDEIYTVVCSYKPSDYITLLGFRNRLEENKSISIDNFNSAKKTFDNASYFILTLGLKDSSEIIKQGISNVGEYTQRINDITFNMSKYAYLLTEEGDTIRSSMHDFQRSYGMSPNATIMFAFLKDRISASKSNVIRFVYEDNYFGIAKPIQFKFNTNKIFKELPKLKLTSDE